LAKLDGWMLLPQGSGDTSANSKECYGMFVWAHREAGEVWKQELLSAEHSEAGKAHHGQEPPEGSRGLGEHQGKASHVLDSRHTALRMCRSTWLSCCWGSGRAGRNAGSLCGGGNGPLAVSLGSGLVLVLLNPSGTCSLGSCVG